MPLEPQDEPVALHLEREWRERMVELPEGYDRVGVWMESDRTAALAISGRDVPIMVQSTAGVWVQLIPRKVVI